MLSNKYLVQIVFWEHLTRIESHTEGSYMRPQFSLRWHIICAVMTGAKHCIKNFASMAIRKTKVLSRFRDKVQFVRWIIISHPISTIVCKPQVTSNGVPIKADAVPNTLGIDLHITAVWVQACN